MITCAFDISKQKILFLLPFLWCGSQKYEISFHWLFGLWFKPLTHLFSSSWNIHSTSSMGSLNLTPTIFELSEEDLVKQTGNQNIFRIISNQKHIWILNWFWRLQKIFDTSYYNYFFILVFLKKQKVMELNQRLVLYKHLKVVKENANFS